MSTIATTNKENNKMATGTETIGAAWLLQKLAIGVVALVGGLSLLAFWTPSKLRERGRIAGVFIAGALAATVGIVFTEAIATWLNVPNWLLVVAWVLGFISVPFSNAAANYFKEKESMSIFDLADDIKARGKTIAPEASIEPLQKKTRTRTRRPKQDV